ncbi:MAG: hypothetical protein C0412_17330 [Flavobacterium sp.]|nr:hypothetical protein [Flavobacterium sp.]
MRIGINASFARKANTGIGQVTINFLKKLIDLQAVDSKMQADFVLYLEEDLSKDFKLPKNFTKKIFKPLWRRDDLIRKIWWEKYALPRQIKKDECDVFFSLYQSATILPNKVKHIMLVHDIIPHLFPEYLNNSRKNKYYVLTRKAVEKAEKIITISHRSEKDLIQHWHLDPAKITVAHIDVDEAYKRKVSQAESQRVMRKYKLKPGYIYNAGGLEARKNIETLIKAYKDLRERNKQSHFLEPFPQLAISGRLMPKLSPLILDVQKLVHERNLSNHVKLLDFVPQNDMPVLYHNAGLFVYPSFYEGFGLPILEAMNQNIPVITSKRSSLPEVGLDSILYFDPKSEKDLMMVMKNVLLNKDLRETLKKRGRERARDFSWDNFVKKFINIVQEMKLD